MTNRSYDYSLLEIFDDDSSEILSTHKFDKIREASSKVVVFSTDWTTETIVSQIKRGNIDLTPAFQRRDAWTIERKSKFIESLFLGLPVPQIVLAESQIQKGKFIVIDGKQRLLTIMQFCDPDDQNFKDFKLKSLEILTGLNGKKREDIETAGIFPGMEQVDIASFYNQPIRTVVIRNWIHDAVLYEIFLRLNQGSVQLSPQELRQALLPGPFTSFIDISSADNPAIKEILNLKGPDRRMRDAELLLRYYAFNNLVPFYDGDLKDFFDRACELYNRTWDRREDDLFEQLNTFRQAYDAAKIIFGEKNVFRKWGGNKFETRINRPLFDVLMFYLSQRDIREDAIQRKETVLEEFKSLFDNDYDFKASVERGTANILPTRYRFNKIAEILSASLGREIVAPLVAMQRSDQYD